MTAVKGLELVAARERWIAAQRFKARVQRLLAPQRVSFTQWLVLEALAEDPPYSIHQVDLAGAIGVSERVVSYTVAALCERGLADHREEFVPQFESIFITDRGYEILQNCRQILKDAAHGSRLCFAA